MATTPQRQINGEKLEAEIKRRGVTIAEACGTIAERALFALEQKFNIAYEDISDPAVEVSEPAEGGVKTTTFTREELDYLAAKIVEELGIVARTHVTPSKYPQIEFRELRAE